MIGIVDYGMGNLRSVQKALQRCGAAAEILRRPDEVAGVDRLVLPGVGAFADAIGNLRSGGWDEPILRFIDTGKPFLGICLGLQLLFEVSCEDGEHRGLGVLPGKVVRFEPTDRALKVPHMGWNALRFEQPDHPLFAGLAPGCCVYFVHSYYAAPAESTDVAATADYDGPFCASVRRNNVWATQFHPEKSQQVGLTMLANFAKAE